MFQGMARNTPLGIWKMARTSATDLNPTTIVQRSGTVAATVKSLGQATLLVHRSADGMGGYLIAPDIPAAGQTAKHLSHAVGARAEKVDSIDLVGDDDFVVTGRLVARRRSAVTRDVQAGLDPTETARLLANTIAVDGWVALVLRDPSTKERKRHRKWLGYRLGSDNPTHHSMASESLVMTVWAGGDSAAEVRTTLDQVASSLPGFDVETDARTSSRVSAVAKVAAVALLAAVGVVPAAASNPAAAGGLAAVALACIGWAASLWMGAAPSRWRDGQRAAYELTFPSPAKRSSKPKAPRKEQIRGDKTITADEGDYPLARDCFLVGPQVAFGVVAPHAGAVSGDASTATRSAPPALLRQIGPMVGNSETGEHVFLSSEAQRLGVAIAGSAGSGKSQITRSLFAWACLERTRNGPDIPGAPGRHNALVAFESKGEGTEKYRQWSEALGDRTLVIDVADINSYGIDVFAVPGTNTERALFFANALRYAYSDSDIGHRSFKSLSSVFTAALAITPEIAATVSGLDPNGSPVVFAHCLLGGFGDQMGVDLHASLSAESARTGDPVLAEGVAALSSLYAGATPAQRRNLIESSENKTFQLSQLEAWWTPRRSRVTWDRILSGHRSVIINTGTSASGAVIDENLSQVIGSLLLFSLRNAIQRNCADWYDTGQSVTIFSDELSLLAANSPEVLTWLRDQGRSYGVRPILATQRPEQLIEKVRSAFLDFETLVSFRINNEMAAAEMARAIGSSEGWTAADIQHLPAFTAAVKTSVAGQPVSAFTVPVANFESDLYAFPAAQGYPDVVTPAPVAPAPTPMVPAAPTFNQAPVERNDFAEPAASPEPVAADDFGDDFEEPAGGDLSTW